MLKENLVIRIKIHEIQNKQRLMAYRKSRRSHLPESMSRDAYCTINYETV